MFFVLVDLTTLVGARGDRAEKVDSEEEQRRRQRKDKWKIPEMITEKKNEKTQNKESSEQGDTSAAESVVVVVGNR